MPAVAIVIADAVAISVSVAIAAAIAIAVSTCWVEVKRQMPGCVSSSDLQYVACMSHNVLNTGLQERLWYHAPGFIETRDSVHQIIWSLALTSQQLPCERFHLTYHHLIRLEIRAPSWLLKR